MGKESTWVSTVVYTSGEEFVESGFRRKVSIRIDSAL